MICVNKLHCMIGYASLIFHTKFSDKRALPTFVVYFATQRRRKGDAEVLLEACIRYKISINLLNDLIFHVVFSFFSCHTFYQIQKCFVCNRSNTKRSSRRSKKQILGPSRQRSKLKKQLSEMWFLWTSCLAVLCAASEECLFASIWYHMVQRRYPQRCSTLRKCHAIRPFGFPL